MSRVKLFANALSLVILCLALSAHAGTLQIVPTTTLTAETARNTSASNLFQTTSNGDLGGGNVSKVDIHSLLYPGYSGRIYAHLMGWFCMNAGSTSTGPGTMCGSHIQVGYKSSDPAQIHAQVEDMISRGINGVIHDWYGQGSNSDTEATNMIAEAQLHASFTYATMIDQGAIKWYSCYPGCTATIALTQIAQYAANTYFASPAYLRVGGRPVLLGFGLGGFSIDWNYVAANTPGNPIWLFQSNGGFTHAQTGGSYAWVMPDDPNYGLDYLSSFYSTGNNYPSLYMVGATYKGFNDTLASWSANRVMDQQCGQTWLQTFARINSSFNSTNQLDALQLVTWDDYEEGTEIESGIDNCVTVSGAVSGKVLNWTISGSESTIDHYTVFISLDGQNLMPLADFPAGTHQLDLGSFSLGAGNYTLYVKAVGKPSMRNQMSAAVAYAVAGSAPAVLISPTPGSTLTSSSVTFNWSAGTGVSSYWLWIGTAPGTLNLYDAFQGTNNSVTVNGLPANGKPLYVRLFSNINGSYQYNDYVYTAYTTPCVPAAMISPTAGSTLTSSSMKFTWNAGTGVSSYWMWIGTAPGTLNLYDANQGTNSSVTVNGLPSNGKPIYVRLFSDINGTYQYKDYTYTAYATPPVPAAMISPKPGSTLSGPSITFTWSTGTGVTSYWVWIGTAPGALNLYDANQGTKTSVTVNNLPTNGGPVYLRLFSCIDGTWQYVDYSYVTGP